MPINSVRNPLLNHHDEKKKKKKTKLKKYYKHAEKNTRRSEGR